MVFRSGKEIKLGNCKPIVGCPQKASLILNQGERIIGVCYEKPRSNTWLLLQSGFYFIVA